MRTSERTYMSTLKNEPDRLSPSHDAIVEFFADRDNMGTMLAAHFGQRCSFDTPLMSYAIGTFNGRPPLGYLDLLVKNIVGRGHLVIEVKVVVRSVPNLVQQINAYRALIKRSDLTFMLVTPLLYNSRLKSSKEALDAGIAMEKQLADQGVEVFQILNHKDLWSKFVSGLGIKNDTQSLASFLEWRGHKGLLY